MSELAFVNAVPIKEMAQTLINKSRNLTNNDLVTMAETAVSLKSDVQYWKSEFLEESAALLSLQSKYDQLLREHEDNKSIGYSFWGRAAYSSYWSIYDTNTTVLRDSGLEGQTSLSAATFLKAETIPSNFFKDCTNLEKVSIPAATSFGRSVFGNCVNLKVVIAPNLDMRASTPNIPFSQLTTLNIENYDGPLSMLGTNVGGWAIPFGSQLSYLNISRGIAAGDQFLFSQVKNNHVIIDCSAATHDNVAHILDAFSYAKLQSLNCSYFDFYKANVGWEDYADVDTFTLRGRGYGLPANGFVQRTRSAYFQISNLECLNKYWYSISDADFEPQTDFSHLRVNNLTVQTFPPANCSISIEKNGRLTLLSTEIDSSILSTYTNSSAEFCCGNDKQMTVDFTRLEKVPALPSSFINPMSLNFFQNYNTFLLPASLSNSFIKDSIWAKIFLQGGNKVEWI